MENNRKISTVLFLSFLVLTINLCEIRGASTSKNTSNSNLNTNTNTNANTNSRVYKPTQRNSFNSANYWPRDSYVDAAEYSANSGGFGSGTTGVGNGNSNGDSSYLDPSGGFQGGNGNGNGNAGGQGNKGPGSDTAYGIPEQSSSYYSYGTPDYSYNKGAVSGGYGSGSGSSSGTGWKAEGPSYKFKYHVYPHPDPVESNGWGWSGEESIACRRGEECDTKGGGGGGKESSGLAGLIGLLGLKGLLPLAPLIPLLFLPLALLLPLPFLFFPPGTVNSLPANLNTSLLKLGRALSESAPSIKYNVDPATLADENYVTVNPVKILKKVEGARNFVMDTYESIVKTDGKDGERNSCVERFSCEIRTMARNLNVNKYLDTALQTLLPFKSKSEQKDNLISRFSRGLSSSGNCQSFACRPFFKAERM